MVRDCDIRSIPDAPSSDWHAICQAPFAAFLPQGEAAVDNVINRHTLLLLTDTDVAAPALTAATASKAG